MTTYRLRPAAESDVPAILACIRGLAEYERLPHECVATEGLLRETLFSPRPYAEVLFGYEAGEAVAFCLFFHSYSTFLARPGIYLEDLFVFPEHRGHGLGRRLLASLARTAVERGYGRVEWAVLDWNADAIAFYRSIGAVGMDAWRVQRLAGDALERLAATAGP